MAWISRVLREGHTRAGMGGTELCVFACGMVYAGSPRSSDLGMNRGNVKWGVLAAVGAVGLLLMWALPPLPRQKARAQRINAVNTVARISFTLPVANAPPTNAPSAAATNHRPVPA